jgi:hypothetical protein
MSQDKVNGVYETTAFPRSTHRGGQALGTRETKVRIRKEELRSPAPYPPACIAVRPARIATRKRCGRGSTAGRQLVTRHWSHVRQRTNPPWWVTCPPARQSTFRLGECLTAPPAKTILAGMSAQEIIEQIKALPAKERAQVAKFVVENDDSWIPESFRQGMADAEAGRLVDLDTALNESYPPGDQ